MRRAEVAFVSLVPSSVLFGLRSHALVPANGEALLRSAQRITRSAFFHGGKRLENPRAGAARPKFAASGRRFVSSGAGSARASAEGNGTGSSSALSAPQKLRKLLEEPGIKVMPCCFDALSARLIQKAGFQISFMSGFAVSATRVGFPDTGLISYREMVDTGTDICNSISIPVIGDGDTGYGNALNVKRTVRGYAKAGFGAIMIEDQLAPKKCGHTRGKQVVSRDEAFSRVKAAVDAARDSGILILARTDARGPLGLDEAIYRANVFTELGAELLFVEAPQNIEEMGRICTEAPGTHLCNMLEFGKTPILPPAQLEELGFRVAAYPLTLMSSAIKAMQRALTLLKEGKSTEDRDLLPDFTEVQELVGFPEYWTEEELYSKPPIISTPPPKIPTS